MAPTQRDHHREDTNMDTTTTPVIGQLMAVTDAQEAPHYFRPGTTVRVLQDNAHKATTTRPALPAHRWLCRGRSATGSNIVQWLAAEDLTAL